MKKEKPQYPKWLRVENALNPHKQFVTIICRSEIELERTKERYTSRNYSLSVLDSDPRNQNLKQRKVYS